MESEENGITAQPASQSSPIHCAAVWVTQPTYGPKCCFFFPYWQQFPLRGLAVPSKFKHLDDFWREGSWSFSVCHPLNYHQMETGPSHGQWEPGPAPGAALPAVTLWPPGTLTPDGAGEGCSSKVLFVLQPQSPTGTSTQATLALPAPEVFLLFPALCLAHCSHYSETSSCSWRSKASCLLVSWAREATGMGTSLQMSMELQKITWDNLLQTPPTSNQKGQTSLCWLEWYFLKSLVLYPCWSQWEWPIWEQVSVPQNISPWSILMQVCSGLSGSCCGWGW